MRTWIFGATTLLIGLGACGGKAIVDDPLGAGGAGGAGNAGGSTSSDGGDDFEDVNAVGIGAGPTTTTGGGASACEIACNDLWTCTQEDNNCPGLSPADEVPFIAGCVEGCEQFPFGDLIDTDECRATVGLLKSVNPEFANACDNGI